jgi:hypothetical protein
MYAQSGTQRTGVLDGTVWTTGVDLGTKSAWLEVSQAGRISRERPIPFRVRHMPAE